MSDPIAPALSAEEWADLPSLGYFDWDCGIVDVSYQNADYQNLPAKIIAVSNAALPDDDRRKITRAHVALLREMASVHEAESGDDWHEDVTPLRALADVLESYLPPESE